ncbi:MAG: LLM class flavin-dependent oxidoreductase [Limnochordales bacterium]
MELGLVSFVESTPLADSGKVLSPEERLRNLMEEIELADQLGLDVFGIGEHHRPDYVSSAPAVIMAAAAARTKNIRLSSAVTVLSSDDPVRGYQQFATVDLLSGGRVEIMVGRGSFIESFPLFGYDLHDYDELFEEKLELLLEIIRNEKVTWSGKHRPAIPGLGVYPRAKQERLPVWIAVGGTPESAVRAGRLGLPMAIAIIGGLPERFSVFAELHRRAAEQAGHPRPPLSINSHGFIADTSQEAMDIAYPAFKYQMDRIGRERGWPPMTREQFEASCTLRGANFVGSPQQVIDKILYQYEIFGHDRFTLQITVGSMPHDKVMRAIELFGTEVAPVVRKEVARKRSGGSA